MDRLKRFLLKFLMKARESAQACFLKNKHDDLLDSFKVISCIIYHIVHC